MNDYELELEKAVKEIRKAGARLVCIQLPDGLKRYADEIQKEIESKTKADVIIWLGSCFGACDIPRGLENIGVDLLIQWGHEEWKQ
jgi:2-(3-amino-3-carboxypropyl)histidine synthase